MRKISLLLFLLLFVFVRPTFAHQSGCHRWHSCPSDTGSYNCGDLGYTSGCGGAAPLQQVYSTPIPAFPEMTATTEYSANSDQTYDVQASLNDENPTEYSVSLNKTAGA